MDLKELRGLMEAYSKVHAPIEELYKGKHGQSEKEYQDDRSHGGKMISGDSKHSGAAWSHRSYKGVGEPAKPGERQKHQGKMDKGTRSDLEYRKAKLKKEEVDIFDTILEFLQAEGYAETLEEAEWIMANQLNVEDIEAILDEAYVDYRRGKLPSGRTPQQAAKGRESALKARQKKDEVLGKGSNPETYQQRGRLSKQSDTVSQMDRATTLGSRFPTRGNPGIVRGEPNTGRHQSAITKRDAIKASKEADKKTRG